MGEQLRMREFNAPVSALAGPLVFVDIETDGMSHTAGRVIEVAAIRVENGRIVRTFNQLVNPGHDVPAFITGLTGIRNQELYGALPFARQAGELADVLDGALFIAHNVRFDYSFLKAEFKRVGKNFLPRQLCTVKLSRTLFPQEKSHKLESLIARHGFTFEKRHRAYDDALVLWQFLQLVTEQFDPVLLQAAITKQLKQPAMPKGLAGDLVKGLPEAPGVYIFQDEQGRPLYIGKSINIKKRVLQHFGHDHDDNKEYKIAQAIRHVETRQTGGELEALLLESQLVKEQMPLYNRKLRQTNKLLVARSAPDKQGYLTVKLEEAVQSALGSMQGVLAVYERRNKAKAALEGVQKLFDLCPKLLGLEKSSRGCFLHQLGKCRGACAGHETAESYNQRLLLAFERQRIRDWPYQGPVLVQEKFNESLTSAGVVVDQWCLVDDAGKHGFDLDTYKILHSFLTAKLNKLIIKPIRQPV